MASLTHEQYIDALKKHGRRVANRLVLSTMPVAGRKLADFYACYGEESGLPANEVSRTSMSAVFDPAGWMVYYEAPVYSLWSEPPKAEPT
jgi:hypothetical protein